jgi:hypothetical protein
LKSSPNRSTRGRLPTSKSWIRLSDSRVETTSFLLSGISPNPHHSPINSSATTGRIQQKYQFIRANRDICFVSLAVRLKRQSQPHPVRAFFAQRIQFDVAAFASVATLMRDEDGRQCEAKSGPIASGPGRLVLTRCFDFAE